MAEEQGCLYKDFGTYTAESCDYPDYAHALVISEVEQENVIRVLSICGSGQRHQHDFKQASGNSGSTLLDS